MSDLAKDLVVGLEQMGLALPILAQERLVAYLKLLLKWNKTYNLTAIQEPERMLGLHLLDSLAIVPYIAPDRLLDVGSGGGLPGIPVAVAVPGVRVTLLDSNGKKCAFLRQVAIELGLANVDVVHSRVEVFTPDACYRQIVSRAFSDLAEFARLSSHLLCEGGEWLAMKGVRPHEEMARLQGVRVKQDIQLEVPGLDAERHLIIMEPKE
jgi:16S rRNA (guanine527-N7)-methyltransferase